MKTIKESFKNKCLVITGGTGSFGSSVLKHFLTTDIGEIRIFSRDEKKQDWMRHGLQASYCYPAVDLRKTSSKSQEHKIWGLEP